MAKFGRQINVRIFEIYIKKRLLEFLQPDFVLRKDIIPHGDYLTVSLNETIGFRVFVEVKASYLV